MSKEDRQGGSLIPASLPPETGVIDARWDDDAIEFFINEPGERADPFDRVTTIPDEPPEEYAMRLMAEADRAERQSQGREPGRGAARPMDPLSSPKVPVFDRVSEPEITLTHLDPLSLDLDDSQFDGPHYEVEIDKPSKPMRAFPAPLMSAEAPAKKDPKSLLSELTDRYAMGDFSGALLVAETILEKEPENAEANRLATSCRDVLLQMYNARLGSLGQLVTVIIPSDQIRWLSLDHRAGFLLSLADGLSSIEEILDVSGMTRLDALRIMCTLLEQRIIALEPGLSR